MTNKQMRDIRNTEIIRLYNSGLAQTKIASMMKLTPAAVCIVLKNNNITTSDWKDKSTTAERRFEILRACKMYKKPYRCWSEVSRMIYEEHESGKLYANALSIKKVIYLLRKQFKDLDSL